ncbi:hypothetical protein KP509_15G021900 [Ceratopteris richardii]|uniref:Arginyl-tRNA--protein transferase n=3 Tax=Ceratopteris richardii TaxID=49495 RepID=A0A8T2T7N4_CERRI|nr:hypothetical protein KP509_15G021900 [Ceratopteris richardii]
MDISTIVKDWGFYGTTCGYCGSESPSSHFYGLWAHSLSPHDFQELLDQSWKRSGMLLYRPLVERSCCQLYTIRLKADCMERSSENIRTVRRMQRYLDGIYDGPSSKRNDNLTAQEYRRDDMENQCETLKMEMNTELEELQTCSGDSTGEKGKHLDRDSNTDTLKEKICSAISDCIQKGELPDTFDASKIVVQKFRRRGSRRHDKLSGGLCYTCNVAFPYAAALFKQNTDCKLLKSLISQSQGIDDIEGKITHQCLASALADIIALKLERLGNTADFKVQACNGHLNFFMVPLDTSYTIGPNDSEIKQSKQKNTMNKISLPVNLKCAVKHKLEIHTKDSVFDPEEFSLYKKYQVAIHNENPEDITERSFRRFLVDTPLTFTPFESMTESGSFPGFGSFHQQYLIDGQLVAVSVIDVLPSCLSSTYFFWDPDFAFLSLGRYSALKEIEWIQEAKKYCETLEYYYLGHYIHSCPKMHYKVSFRPSELLCPIRFQWVPFDLARPLLEKPSHFCLSDTLLSAQKLDQEDGRIIHCTENTTGDFDKALEAQEVVCGAGDNAINEEDMDNMILLFRGIQITLGHLRLWLEPMDKDLQELTNRLQDYMRFVGVKLASRMAYVLP